MQWSEQETMSQLYKTTGKAIILHTYITSVLEGA